MSQRQRQSIPEREPEPNTASQSSCLLCEISALVAHRPANRLNLRACNAACKWEERQDATSQLLHPKPIRCTLIWSVCLESNTYFSILTALAVLWLEAGLSCQEWRARFPSFNFTPANFHLCSWYWGMSLLRPHSSHRNEKAPTVLPQKEPEQFVLSGF